MNRSQDQAAENNEYGDVIGLPVRSFLILGFLGLRTVGFHGFPSLWVNRVVCDSPFPWGLRALSLRRVSTSLCLRLAHAEARR